MKAPFSTLEDHEQFRFTKGCQNYLQPDLDLDLRMSADHDSTQLFAHSSFPIVYFPTLS